MRRVLMLASVASMIDQFNMGNIELLQEMGYMVDVACNFNHGNTCSDERIADLKKRLEQKEVNYYQIDFSRNVLKLKQDLVAYKQVKKLLDKNVYTFIHCHSPIGGVIGRLAGHNADVRVIYTAHGFHFYKGAPIKNWLIFYPIEKWLARYTDILITMNDEDHKLAGTKFAAKHVEYIHGIGIRTDIFNNVKTDVEAKKAEFNIPMNANVLLSVGELISRKNHRVIIEALATIKDLNWHYIICGRGPCVDELRKRADELGISDKVHLPGFRADIAEICSITDIYLFPSVQEGLPAALMEAMASGLPVIVSDIRGNTDLVQNGRNGYLVPVHDSQNYAKRIAELLDDAKLRREMGERNREDIQAFDESRVLNEMREIYNKMN